MCERRRYRNILNSLLFLVAVVGFVACAPSFHGRNRITEISITGDEKLFYCKDISERSEQIKNFRLLERVRSERNGETTVFRYAIVGNDSGDLRIELLPPTGVFTLAILSLTREGAVLLDTQERTVQRAKDERVLLQKMFGRLSITRAQLVGLLTGGVDGDCSEMQLTKNEGGGVTIRQESAAWILDRDLRLNSFYWNDQFSSTEIASGKVSRLQEGVPAKWRVLVNQLSLQVEGELELAKFNQPISPSLFKLAIPSDYKELSDQEPNIFSSQQ